MHKMKKYIVFGLAFLLLVSMSSDFQKKRIRSGEFDIECYVYIKPMDEFIPGKEYYWFKAGEIHNSVSTSGGLVLHKEYFKYYRSNQMAEKGQFDFGLKDGIWQTWFENGQVESYTEWKEGFKHGKYLAYNQNGELVQSGQYRNNKPVKTWIDYKSKDTIFYKQDSAYVDKPKTKTGLLIESIFKPKDSLEKVERKLEKENKKLQDSIKRAEKKKEKRNKKVQDSIAKAQRKS